MSKWKYVFESVCVPCEESGWEQYGEMYSEKVFDTKEEAEAHLKKCGGEKDYTDDYATVKQYITEVVDVKEVN